MKGETRPSDPEGRDRRFTWRADLLMFFNALTSPRGQTVAIVPFYPSDRQVQLALSTLEC